MEKMVFSCPECGGHIIQTVRSNSPIIYEFQEGHAVFGVDHEGPVVHSLYCNDCGFLIGKFSKDIGQNLWVILSENGWLRKKVA